MSSFPVNLQEENPQLQEVRTRYHSLIEEQVKDLLKLFKIPYDRIRAVNKTADFIKPGFLVTLDKGNKTKAIYKVVAIDKGAPDWNVILMLIASVSKGAVKIYDIENDSENTLDNSFMIFSYEEVLKLKPVDPLVLISISPTYSYNTSLKKKPYELLLNSAVNNMIKKEK